METWQRLVFCDLMNKQDLDLSLSANPPCITFPFNLQLREICSMRNMVFGDLFVHLFVFGDMKG